jgi:hypothetical protein
MDWLSAFQRIGLGYESDYIQGAMHAPAKLAFLAKL